MEIIETPIKDLLIIKPAVFAFAFALPRTDKGITKKQPRLKGCFLLFYVALAGRALLLLAHKSNTKCADVYQS